ncbi:MAG TPA: hypothetical protein VFW11_23210 [Cyclobacteriaceae bacterium]|nr:hypothetical protein [Cyclobacteriaceae bacterium]
MEILIFKNYEELSKRAAEEIASTIEAKPNAVICLASGDSPRRTCEIFVQEAKQKRLDLSGAHFVGWMNGWASVQMIQAVVNTFCGVISLIPLTCIMTIITCSM